MNSTKDYDGFVGREVLVDEVEQEYKGHKYINYEVAGSDSVISDIESVAAKKKHIVRVWFPDIAGTADFRTNRINVSVEKDAKGVWRIESVKFG